MGKEKQIIKVYLELNDSTKIYFGSYKANSFAEACNVIGSQYPKDYKASTRTIWGMKLCQDNTTKALPKMKRLKV